MIWRVSGCPQLGPNLTKDASLTCSYAYVWSLLHTYFVLFNSFYVIPFKWEDQSWSLRVQWERSGFSINWEGLRFLNNWERMRRLWGQVFNLDNGYKYRREIDLRFLFKQPESNYVPDYNGADYIYMPHFPIDFEPNLRNYFQCHIITNVLSGEQTSPSVCLSICLSV